ncbi:MAG: YibE/F family protein [Oscillospiraceae bacterium]
MKKNRDRLYYAILLILSVAFVVFGSTIASRDAKMFIGQNGDVLKKRIVRVDTILSKDEREISIGGKLTATETKIKFTGTVLFGEQRGDAIAVTQTYNTLQSRIPTPVREGDWIFAYQNIEVSTEYYSGEYIRITGIAIFGSILLVLLIVFGRSKGFSTIIALMLSVLSIFLVFIPSILSGYNVYLCAMIICAYTIGITPFLIGGFNRKSVASALGSIGGVAVAGILTYILNVMLRITGAVDEETMMVTFIRDTPIDLRAITFATIIIGALGATLDVSMSISSAISEMHDTQPGANVKKLTKSGINIGQDIIGTQISTVVLAYIGCSLPTVLLLVAYQSSMIELLNLEMIIVELLQMLIGAATILFTIPTTAVVTAWLFSHDKKTRQNRYAESAEAYDNIAQTDMPPKKELHEADVPEAGKPYKASRHREL